jgi:hypothetical protein
MMKHNAHLEPKPVEGCQQTRARNRDHEKQPCKLKRPQSRPATVIKGQNATITGDLDHGTFNKPNGAKDRTRRMLSGRSRSVQDEIRDPANGASHLAIADNL